MTANNGKLYAMIRKDSEYFGRQDTKEPFPVTFQDPPYDGMVVKGGPGGQYALWDVVFYIDDGANAQDTGAQNGSGGRGTLTRMPGQLDVDDWPKVWGA